MANGKPGRPRKNQETDVERLARLERENAGLKSALVEEATRNKEMSGELNIPVSAREASMVKLIKTGGSWLHLIFRDRFGQPKEVALEQLGDSTYVSLDQLDEIQSAVPSWFEKGWITIEGEEQENPNIVLDYKELLALDIDAISERVAAMTEAPTLNKIAYELDASRFETEDADGKPHVDAEGKPQAKVKGLSAKEQVLFHAVASRIQELTGQVIQLADG